MEVAVSRLIDPPDRQLGLHDEDVLVDPFGSDAAESAMVVGGRCANALIACMNI